MKPYYVRMKALEDILEREKCLKNSVLLISLCKLSRYVFLEIAKAQNIV